MDELLCQYDWQRKPWFTLMDDGGDLVALCDRDPSTLRGRVCAEYTYDAYGAVLTAMNYSPMSANAHPHCGHKGLFVDRLDAPIAGATNYETPRLYPISSPLCQNRNRAYMPTAGRFLQMDPNETGQSLVAAVSYNGRGAAAISVAFGIEEHYADGASVYAYLESNPWSGADPLGLFSAAELGTFEGGKAGNHWDPFDLVDDYITEDAGSKAAFMERIISGGHTAAYVVTFLGSWLSGPVGILAGVANGLLGQPESLQGTMVGATMHVATQAAFMFNLARFTTALLRAGAQYAVQYGTRALAGAAARGSGLAARILSWAGGHHIIPVYMRGLPVGTRIRLTHAQHVEVHQLINEAGRRYGIPPRSGPGGGRQAVDGWLARSGPMGPTQMRAALIEAYSRFDARHGTNLFGLFFKEVMSQQWLP